jgi:hypothetical protein
VCRRPPLTKRSLRAHLIVASGATFLAIALIGPGSALAANPPGSPNVEIKRIVASSSPDELISKGVRVLVSTDTNCRLDASVYLGEAVPGLGKRNARIAGGSLLATGGQTAWLTAKLTRHAVKALRNEAGKLSLALRVRITATAT